MSVNKKKKTYYSVGCDDLLISSDAAESDLGLESWDVENAVNKTWHHAR